MRGDAWRRVVDVGVGYVVRDVGLSRRRGASGSSFLVSFACAGGGASGVGSPDSSFVTGLYVGGTSLLCFVLRFVGGLGLGRECAC